MNTPNRKLTSLKLAQNHLARMRQLGWTRDPLALEQLRLSLSPLKNGELGAKIGKMLDQTLTSAEVLQESSPTPKVSLPNIPAEWRIVVGHEIGTGRVVAFVLN